MSWRHPKMSSSTQKCDVPPKNVLLPPKDRLGPPENVLVHPKKFWATTLFLCLPRECSEIAGLGSAAFQSARIMTASVRRKCASFRSVPQQLLGANGVQLSQASCFLQVL